MQQIIETIKVARPGFWPTHIWFYLLPFAKQEMFASPAFWLGAIYICFPLSLLLYGWNDLGDTQTDELNPRKGTWLFGACPDDAQRRRLPWIIALVQIPFLTVFVWIAGWKMLGWFAAVCLVNWTYNNGGLKRLPVLDLLNQVGYLLIFVLASWICSVEQLNAPAMMFSALFAMQSHLFGQIMDVEEDQIGGRKTTAVVIGVRNAKLLLSAMMLGEALIAILYFSYDVVPGFMICGALFFFADAMFGPKKYPLLFVKTFFIAWNVIAILTMYFIWHYGVFILPS